MLVIPREFPLLPLLTGTQRARPENSVRTHTSLSPDLPVCLVPPRRGNSSGTEGQGRLRVYVGWWTFLGHGMPTVTDGLDPEESRCWACLGRGRREDPASTSTIYGLYGATSIIPEPKCPRRRPSGFQEGCIPSGDRASDQGSSVFQPLDHRRSSRAYPATTIHRPWRAWRALIACVGVTSSGVVYELISA